MTEDNLEDKILKAFLTALKFFVTDDMLPLN